MTVVSNASPLIALMNIGHLDLLRHLYGQVMVPPAVYSEVFDMPAAEGSPTWIQRKSIKWNPTLAELGETLGAGEAQAIILALEVGADLLILDDLTARKRATQLKVPVAGVLGVLVAAKEAHIVPKIEPLIARLEGAGFRMTAKLKQMVLCHAREK